MKQSTILVVEDDAAIRRGLVDALQFAGFRVLERENGRDGLDCARSAAIDLLLLDVILPGMSGFELLEELRTSHPALPVIMVTARGAENDRVQGLRIGADDYVVKPFSARELLARVEAVLRRSAERPSDVKLLDLAGRAIDLDRREVRFEDGAACQLTEREAGILRYLASNRGRAVSRDELLQRVWGLDPRGLQTRTVDMHVARLRDKLKDDSDDHRIIVTVRAKGYMLTQDPRSEACA